MTIDVTVNDLGTDVVARLAGRQVNADGMRPQEAPAWAAYASASGYDPLVVELPRPFRVVPDELRT